MKIMTELYTIGYGLLVVLMTAIVAVGSQFIFYFVGAFQGATAFSVGAALCVVISLKLGRKLDRIS